MATAENKQMLDEMLAAGCHFGHRAAKWNPKMRKFIFGSRDGIHIFDLEVAHAYMQKALDFIHEACSQGKTVLLVSTKLQATKILQKAAEDAECPYVTRKWIPGLLTNFDTVKKRIKYFKDLKQQRDTGEWDKYTKKERNDMQKTLVKLEAAFGGVQNLVKVPDVVIVLDALRDQLALKEAKRLKIATVGICDSNSDPDFVTYPIPGNDDAVKSLTFFLDKIREAIRTGTKGGAK